MTRRCLIDTRDSYANAVSTYAGGFEGVASQVDPSRTSGLDPARVRIMDLCDDAGVANKSLRAHRTSSVREGRSFTPTATLVMRAIYSLQPGPIQVRRDTAVPGALLFKSYLPGAIFDHNNGIDKTVPLMQNT